jgi:hypothetical protein
MNKQFTSFQDFCDVVVRAVRVGKHKPNHIPKFSILTRWLVEQKGEDLVASACSEQTFGRAVSFDDFLWDFNDAEFKNSQDFAPDAVITNDMRVSHARWEIKSRLGHLIHEGDAVFDGYSIRSSDMVQLLCSFITSVTN